jgi:DNA uptake protein ComE-like DNA-binding protein
MKMSAGTSNKAITETALTALSVFLFAGAVLLLFFTGSDCVYEPKGVSKLDINKAEPVQLELIQGIGPVTAASIVEHRDNICPAKAFKNADELLGVKGVGDVKCSSITEIVYFGRGTNN